MMGRLNAFLNRLRPPRTVPLFVLSPSIRHQEIAFEFRGRTLSAEASYRTPLYETVAEVVDFDCYQFETLGHPAQPGELIIDVGANIGVTALCLAQIGDPRLVCLEPLAENERFLNRNLSKNGIGRVSVLPNALGERDGVATLLVPEETVGCRLAEGDVPEKTASVEVKTLSLGTLLGRFEGSVWLLKADCEGGEYSLVSQLTEPLVRRIQNLTFEIHDLDQGRNVRTISRRLEDLGYCLTYKRDVFGRGSLHHLLAQRRSGFAHP
jgi:FkbM family methyltransferase